MVPRVLAGVPDPSVLADDLVPRVLAGVTRTPATGLIISPGFLSSIESSKVLMPPLDLSGTCSRMLLDVEEPPDCEFADCSRLLGIPSDPEGVLDPLESIGPPGDLNGDPKIREVIKNWLVSKSYLSKKYTTLMITSDRATTNRLQSSNDIISKIELSNVRTRRSKEKNLNIQSFSRISKKETEIDRIGMKRHL